MAAPLLETKLFIPRLSAHVIIRPDLVERLEQGLSGKFTLISAPAGFGKTTLLSQWLVDRKPSVAWISLDEGDNDPRRFLAYLVAALNKAGVAVDENLFNSLIAPEALEPAAIGTTIINKILASKSEIVIILDDYHVITGKIVHQLLGFLLQNMPPTLHILIATRADPALPLAKLRASGNMTELRAEDLRIQAEWAETYLREVHGLNLPAEDSKKLLHRTEGWIAGLHLAALALKQVEQPRDFIDHFSGSHEYIAEYLTDEVFSGLTAEVQEFLLSTCLLDRFCAALCDAVMDTTQSQDTLLGLKETNSFLACLDAENHWFRYHRLFSDMLRKRVQTRPDLAVERIYERASIWFERQDLYPEAIDYALRAAQFGRALDLLERIVESLIHRSEIDTIMQWVDQLPEGLITTRPLLALMIAWIQLIRVEDTSFSDSILKGLSAGDEVLKGKIHAVQSVNAIFTHADPVASEAHAKQALKMLPEHEIFFRSMAVSNLSAAYYLQGKNAQGLDTLHEAARMGRRTGNVLLAVTALCRIATIAMQNGDLVEAKRLFEEGLALSRDDEGYVLPVAFAAKLGLGKILREWNKPEAAREYLEASLHKGTAWHLSYAIEAYDTLAFVQDALGDPRSAQGSLEQARKLASKTEVTKLDDTYIASQQALLDLRHGNVHAAARWASRNAFERMLRSEVEVKLTLGASIIRIFELMVFARILLAENRPGDALRILEGLAVEGNEQVPMAKRIEVPILQALIHARLQQGKQASTRLQFALELAQPGGYIRLFLEEGAPMYALLKNHKKQPGTRAFHVQLLEAFEGAGYRPEKMDGAGGLPEPLTEREVEVLTYLQSELTVPEIAEQLFVAESTVRTHIKNLYSKLDTHSRFEAISRAKELELL